MATKPPMFQDNIFNAFLAKNRGFNGRVDGLAKSLVLQIERLNMPQTRSTLSFLQDILCISESVDPEILKRWREVTCRHKSKPLTAQQTEAMIKDHGRGKSALDINQGDIAIKEARMKALGWTPEISKAFVHAYTDRHIKKIATICKAAAEFWMTKTQIAIPQIFQSPRPELVAKFVNAGTELIPDRYEMLLRRACIELTNKIIDKVEVAWSQSPADAKPSTSKFDAPPPLVPQQHSNLNEDTPMTITSGYAQPIIDEQAKFAATMTPEFFIKAGYAAPVVYTAPVLTTPTSPAAPTPEQP